MNGYTRMSASLPDGYPSQTSLSGDRGPVGLPVVGLEIGERRARLVERREAGEDRECVPVLRMDDRPGRRVPKGARRGVPERGPERRADGADPGLPRGLAIRLAEPARELGGEAERTDVTGVVVGDGRAPARNVAVVGVGGGVDEQPRSARSAAGTSRPSAARAPARPPSRARGRRCRARSRRRPRPSRRCSRRARRRRRGPGSTGSRRPGAGRARTRGSCCEGRGAAEGVERSSVIPVTAWSPT